MSNKMGHLKTFPSETFKTNRKFHKTSRLERLLFNFVRYDCLSRCSDLAISAPADESNDGQSGAVER